MFRSRPPLTLLVIAPHRRVRLGATARTGARRQEAGSNPPLVPGAGDGRPGDGRAGTILDVLDQERDWYWVVAPPDAHGTRRAGWIRVNQVEAVFSRPATAPRTPATPQANPSADSAATLASIAEDKVTITTRDATTEAARTPPPHRRIRSRTSTSIAIATASAAEDMDPLNAVVAALKADPVLAVNIEGYTCNLGTPAYNLALGVRRANAVQGLSRQPGDWRPTGCMPSSLGEEQPKHDNSREETRRLNRRVALVPEAKRSGSSVGDLLGRTS